MARKKANQGDLLSNMRQPGAGPWAPGVGFCKRSWPGSMLVTSSVPGSGHHQPHAVDKETVFLIL